MSINRTTSKSAGLTIRETTGPKFFTTRDVKEALLFVTPSWKADRAMELVYLPLTWTRDRASEGVGGECFRRNVASRAECICTLCVPSYPVPRNWNVPAWRVCRTNDRFGGFTRKITFPIKHEYSWTERAFENLLRKLQTFSSWNVQWTSVFTILDFYCRIRRISWYVSR